MIRIIFLLFCLFVNFSIKADNYPVYRLDSLKELNYIQSREDAMVYLLEAEYDKEYWEFKIQSLEETKARYRWQAYTSEIIFWVVLVVVGIGIVFSGIQFYIGLTRHRSNLRQSTQDISVKNKKEIENATANSEKDTESKVTETNSVATDTTVKLSAGGIEVKSSVLGVIILVISIAFFYLYLQVVYPINPIETASPPNTATTNSK